MRLWEQAEKEEAALLKKNKPYDDPLLEDYLAKIGDRLLPDNVRAAGGPGYRFGVIRDPTLNAFAMPNGRVYIHTGLLAQVQNEAQLATILGHEMTHVSNRHALSFTRDAQTKQIIYTVAAIAASIGVAAAAGSVAKNNPMGGAVIGQTANAILGLGLQLATIAAINGYGRDLEREADAEGLDRMVRAGYDPKEAPKVFALLKDSSGDRGSLETFFFGSHPRLQERIETTEELIRTKYVDTAGSSATIANTDEFELRMRTVVRDNARLDIAAGRFTLAQRQLDRVLTITPRGPDRAPVLRRPLSPPGPAGEVTDRKGRAGPLGVGELSALGRAGPAGAGALPSAWLALLPAAAARPGPGGLPPVSGPQARRPRRQAHQGVPGGVGPVKREEPVGPFSRSQRSPRRDLRILPVALRGSASTTRTRRGHLNAARLLPQWAISSSGSAWVWGWSMTKAAMSSPSSGWGCPTTAASATAGWVRRAASTSAGDTE